MKAELRKCFVHSEFLSSQELRTRMGMGKDPRQVSLSLELALLLAGIQGKESKLWEPDLL